MTENIINLSDIAMFRDYPDVVTVEELQAMLGIGRNTAYRLIKDGEIKSIKIGKKIRIPKIYIQKYLMIQTFNAMDSTEIFCYDKNVN